MEKLIMSDNKPVNRRFGAKTKQNYPCQAGESDYCIKKVITLERGFCQN